MGGLVWTLVGTVTYTSHLMQPRACCLKGLLAGHGDFPTLGVIGLLDHLLHLGQLNSSCRLSKKNHACSILSSQTNVLGEFGPQWTAQELHFCSPEEALTCPLQLSHRNSCIKQQMSTHQRMPGDLCVPGSLSPRSHLAETQCFVLCTLAQEQSWARSLKPTKNVP